MLKIVSKQIGKSMFLELPSWLEVVSLAETTSQNIGGASFGNDIARILIEYMYL